MRQKQTGRFSERFIKNMGRAAFLRSMIARQKDAHGKGCYFEESWYAHGIFEDRTKRICEHIIPINKKPPDNISREIQIIREWYIANKTQVIDGKPQRKPKKDGVHKIKVPMNPISRIINSEF